MSRPFQVHEEEFPGRGAGTSKGPEVGDHKKKQKEAAWWGPGWGGAGKTVGGLAPIPSPQSLSGPCGSLAASHSWNISLWRAGTVVPPGSRLCPAPRMSRPGAQ